MNIRFWLTIIGIMSVVSLTVWWCVDDGTRSYVSPQVLNFQRSTDDEEIRRVLMLRTPIGQKSIAVLEFIVDELAVRSYFDAHSTLLDELDDQRKSRCEMVATGFLIEGHKAIRVHIGAYPADFPCATNVTACWLFDSEDRLADITIDRSTIGP